MAIMRCRLLQRSARGKRKWLSPRPPFQHTQRLCTPPPAPPNPPTEARSPRCVLSSPCRKASPPATGRPATVRLRGRRRAEGAARKAGPFPSFPARRAGPLPRSFSPRPSHAPPSFAGFSSLKAAPLPARRAPQGGPSAPVFLSQAVSRSDQFCRVLSSPRAGPLRGRGAGPLPRAFSRRREASAELRGAALRSPPHRRLRDSRSWTPPCWWAPLLTWRRRHQQGVRRRASLRRLRASPRLVVLDASLLVCAC